MENKIVEFAGLLRENGVRVSLAETLDAFRALELVGIRDRAELKTALGATMVKRISDLETFEQLFEIFFSGLGEIIKDALSAVQQATGLSDQELQELLERLGELLEGSPEDEFSELVRSLVRRDLGRLERIVREAARDLDLDGLDSAFREQRARRELARRLGLGRLEQELERLAEMLDETIEDEAERARIKDYLARNRRALDEIISRFVRSERKKRDAEVRQHDGEHAILNKNLYFLSERELEQMREAVERLARRLRNVVALRRRRARQGRFDLKKTLRRSVGTGGVPFVLRFTERRREKPRLVVLCDISDSVRNVSRFMLQLVHSLHDLVSRIRSFVFVAELGEVTSRFAGGESQAALDAILRGDVVNVYAHSNFGLAFRIFVRDYIEAVTPRTTVIILGDGRNNYNPPGEWCLREIRERARELIWLNPESRQTWGFGDSEMDRYAPYCTLVEECRNLQQLYNVVDRLVLR